MEISEKHLTDEAIVEAIAARKQPALTELYARYAKLLMGVAYRIFQNRTDAEDLIHDVFIEVWNKAGNYNKSRGKVKTWLVLLTRSRAVDRVRTLAVARKYAMVAQAVDESEPQCTDLDISIDQALVRAAAEKLDGPQRNVLHLNYFEGLSCQEIANQLDTPLGTVKSRLRAAVKNLKLTFETIEEQA